MSDKIQSVIDAGGKCSYVEYKAIYDEIRKKKNPNVLVFGTGHDSKLWVDANPNGLTVFVENHPEWAAYGEKDGYNVVRVAYNTKHLDKKVIASEDELQMDFPDIINDTNWNIIFVDSPVGRTQSRMKSIYNALKLATKPENKKWTTVFVHDYNRPNEQLYVNHFFADFTIEQIDRLARVVCNKQI
jgi:hypothetical protein